MSLYLPMEQLEEGKSDGAVIASCSIINDGTGDERTANYVVTLYNGKRKWKECRVENFPRKKLIGWDILCRALTKMLGTRNSSPNSETMMFKT